MTESPKPTPREQSRLAVGRLTRLLAGLAVAATAAFGVAVASGGKHGSSAAVDQSGASSTSSVVDTSSSDDGYDGFAFAPSQGGVWSTSQSPSATSGGS
jgi:hypothetical protein